MQLDQAFGGDTGFEIGRFFATETVVKAKGWARGLAFHRLEPFPEIGSDVAVFPLFQILKKLKGSGVLA